MAGITLWLLGVPLIVIVLLYLINVRGSTSKCMTLCVG